MMNVVSSGSNYQIYGEDIKTHKRLPVASYEVSFNPFTGYSLTLRPDLAINEEKIYGNHEARVDKVLRSFSLANRNLGVILSGQKGIGKSLFARLLAEKSMESGLPVIVVNGSTPGLSGFLGSIDQEVVVIFDEFEKTFNETEKGDPQEALLSLFDGLDNGKKLFVITCNDIDQLNTCLRNRPGRFHYHFTISNPSDDEIREYMSDKLAKEHHPLIERVVRFGKTVNVTYDYLRAIAFELNQGYSFEEAIGDLNITRSSDVYFDIEVTMSDGSVYTRYYATVDLYRTREHNMRIYGKRGWIDFSFDPSDIKFEDNEMFLRGEDTLLDKDCFEIDDFPGMSEEDFDYMVKNIAIDRVVFRKCDHASNRKLKLLV